MHGILYTCNKHCVLTGLLVVREEMGVVEFILRHEPYEFFLIGDLPRYCGVAHDDN